MAPFEIRERRFRAPPALSGYVSDAADFVGSSRFDARSRTVDRITPWQTALEERRATGVSVDARHGGMPSLRDRLKELA